MKKTTDFNQNESIPEFIGNGEFVIAWYDGRINKYHDGSHLGTSVPENADIFHSEEQANEYINKYPNWKCWVQELEILNPDYIR